MIVWGGYNSGQVDTGARYDPLTDSWTPTSEAGAPTPRENHTAVWTGSEMIVWGGDEQVGYPPSTNVTGSGGRYDPVADTWVALSSPSPSAPRADHSAVWTGEWMIVWGGRNATGRLDNGWEYHVLGNFWSPFHSGGPAAREDHTAVWTGTDMIVWGGTLGGGARYNVEQGMWHTMATEDSTGAMFAFWTGDRLLVSTNGGLGSVYDPQTDSWERISTTGAPSNRFRYSAVWTGDEMIVWGGDDNDGTRLDDGAR